MPLYDVALLGNSDPDLKRFVSAALEEAAARFGLAWGSEFRVVDLAPAFGSDPRSACVVVVFGGPDVVGILLDPLFDVSRVPAIPIASSAKAVMREVPAALRPFNCVLLDTAGREVIASTILGCLGLLPQQRRAFLSYRREDSTAAAVQLFAALSSRQYDVFLDTHSINAAANFQEALWHQLCDVDVLVMLETNGYFASRWTVAEYGRALSKGIGVVRVTWPDSTPSIFTGTASRAELLASELRSDGTLEAACVDRILRQIEVERVTSHAARHRSLVDHLGRAVNLIGGRVNAVGPHRAMHIELASKTALLVQPTIGVPTSLTLQEASDRAQDLDAAVVYDHLGIRPAWQEHLHWLAAKIPGARWVKATEAAWELAAWEAH
jgi:hypothetical protein